MPTDWPAAAPTPTPAPAPTCTVPKLAGKSLKASKKKIKGADCIVGKVTKKKGAKAATGKVVGQNKKTGDRPVRRHRCEGDARQG
jgi:beta-lactam-binding protein with PASTA domain